MPTIKKLKSKHNSHKKSLKSEDLSHLYNSRWARLRDSYLQEHPLCEMCLEKGIIREAQEVHHIKPISTGDSLAEQQGLAYDYSNLKALCIECHHKIHTQMRREH